MGWKVGDAKTITLNGNVGSVVLNNYQCKVYILGFDHNAEKEGNGISFALMESTDATAKQLCLYLFAMNTTNTNSGGWKSCNMRKTFLGSTDIENGDATPTTAASPAANTLMAALPADLRAVLKPITKYTNNVGNSSEASAITATIDYLPLMSEFEVFGSITYANENEKHIRCNINITKTVKARFVINIMLLLLLDIGGSALQGLVTRPDSVMFTKLEWLIRPTLILRLV